MTTNHTLSSSEQSDSPEDVPFENASDNEQSTPMETEQSDQIENTGDNWTTDYYNGNCITDALNPLRVPIDTQCNL